MTASHFYDWEEIGDSEDFVKSVTTLGNDLLWLVAQDGNGFVFRGISHEGFLFEKSRSFDDTTLSQSKRCKSLADISRLVESRPELWDKLTDVLKSQIDKPE